MLGQVTSMAFKLVQKTIPILYYKRLYVTSTLLSHNLVLYPPMNKEMQFFSY